MTDRIFEILAERLGVDEATRRLALRAGRAAGRFTRAGFATTPPEALAERQSICRACPEWDAAALNSTGRCRKCGCSTWAKLRMATESCPLGKWLAISSPSAPAAPPRKPAPAETLGRVI